ncbi:MAG TPA: HAMP domain-containing sensor histidine kinase [Chloroflexia bacterium]
MNYAQALARISSTLNGPADAYTIAREITEEAAELFSAGMASFFMAGDRDLKYVAGFGLPPDFIQQIEEIGRSEAASRYLAGITAPVVVADARTDPLLESIHQLTNSLDVVTLAWAPLINNNQLLGILALYHKSRHDYTQEDLDILHTLAELMALTIANTRRLEAHQQEDKAKDIFLNALSHELRTPLTSIMGFTQIIRKRLSNTPINDPRLMDQMDVLWTQAQRLSRLIDTFVDIAHIEQGEFALNLGKVDLASVIRVAVDQVAAQSRTRHKIVLDLPDEHLWVHGDAKRLAQVFSHVLSNAIRYSPEDEAITLACKHLAQENRALVTITDHGPGIPASRRQRIFERFQQGDTVKAGGLGVGLFITKTVIEAHGGHVSLDSSPNTGTTISIALPL